MDEFLNNNPQNNENTEEVVENATQINTEETENTQSTGNGFADNDVGASFENAHQANQYNMPYNPVVYSPVAPIEDYKPMSKGLKVFAVIMASVILLSAACITGYFLGRGSNNTVVSGSKVNVDLTARPKDTDEMTAAEVYEDVCNSIVGIYIYNDAGYAGQASGIVYSKDGYIVTNDHIYADIAMPKFKIFTHSGKEYDAVYVAGDTVSDLAVLKVNTNELKPAVFGDSSEIYHGQNVVAIGRPSDATTASSITSGIVSSVSRRIQNNTNYSSRVIETTSAINPGSSGGALLDMYGHIIGVTSSKLASNEYDNVGYAIPTVTVKRIAEELISEGKVVSRAKLGITYMEVNSVTADIYDYKYTGIRVASVSDDSDLYGELSEGDTITHINGLEITSDDVVLDVIEQAKAGDKITVTFVTASGSEKTVEAVLAANVSESSYTTQQNNAVTPSNPDGTFDFPDGE